MDPKTVDFQCIFRCPWRAHLRGLSLHQVFLFVLFFNSLFFSFPISTTQFCRRCRRTAASVFFYGFSYFLSFQNDVPKRPSMRSRRCHLVSFFPFFLFSIFYFLFSISTAEFRWGWHPRGVSLLDLISNLFQNDVVERTCVRSLGSPGLLFSTFFFFFSISATELRWRCR